MNFFETLLPVEAIVGADVNGLQHHLQTKNVKELIVDYQYGSALRARSIHPKQRHSPEVKHDLNQPRVLLQVVLDIRVNVKVISVERKDKSLVSDSVFVWLVVRRS